MFGLNLDSSIVSWRIRIKKLIRYFILLCSLALRSKFQSKSLAGGKSTAFGWSDLWFRPILHGEKCVLFVIIYLSVTVFTINVFFFTLSEAVPSIIVTVILSIYKSSICSEESVLPNKPSAEISACSSSSTACRNSSMWQKAAVKIVV